MSDEKNQEKPDLKVLEFSKKKTEGSKVVTDMFKELAVRAETGDIRDFIITFRSESKGIESMVGAGDGIGNFNFVSYIGMLEVLKQRLLDIMAEMMQSYDFEGGDDETD